MTAQRKHISDVFFLIFPYANDHHRNTYKSVGMADCRISLFCHFPNCVLFYSFMELLMSLYLH